LLLVAVAGLGGPAGLRTFMWGAVIAVKSFAFVATGVTYRRPAAPKLGIIGVLALSTVLAAAQVLPSTAAGCTTACLVLVEPLIML
jgi:hypothetical protein